MSKYKSITLLFLMGITLFPWQLLCINHPLGHDHHEHDGPSTCELHEIAAQQGGKHFLPPMDCKHIAPGIDDFNQSQVDKITPVIQTVALVAVLFDLVTLKNQQEPILLLPEPRCRSATLLSDNPLRAPPLI